MPSIKNNNVEITDEALVKQLLSGDETALNELMKRYKRKLYSFIVHYVKNDDIAYDLLQEVFIKVYLKADTFNRDFKFSTWVYRIATNICHDWSRKEKFKNILSLDNLISGKDDGMSYHQVLASNQKNVEQIADLRQQLVFMKNEIIKLPHKLKTALILFSLEGKSQSECAKLLDVTEKTIEMRVYRARKILLEKFKNNFEG
tara:strand:- start:37228 stop:37833 length:606 start_codon:yes stop_codon:yes gene_type:complete